MCEIVAALGPMLKIDMVTIAAEFIRAKVGVRDTLKVPKFTGFTTNDLSIYKIYIEVEALVEKGWLSESKRYVQDEGTLDVADVDGDLKKRHKINSGQEQISLGSLSLAQYEDLKIKGGPSLASAVGGFGVDDKDRSLVNKFVSDMEGIKSNMKG